MLPRRSVICLRLARHRIQWQRPPISGRVQRRHSTTSTTTSPAQLSCAASPLASITNELDKISPRFDVSADSIEILRSPNEFYETLKAKIAKARRRIYLATLYVGKAEHELIDTIRVALKANPELKVSLLTDALRGTRETPEPSCASLLATLISDFGPERVEVRMFHTPNLTGIRKKLLPKRINEGWGLQHMKLYGIDDEIIMSGANLSSDYFTNRQDRYHVFKSKQITDYFENVFQAVCGLSFRVLPSEQPDGFVLDWPQTNFQISPFDDRMGYIAFATKVLAPAMLPTHVSAPKTTDTQVYPLLQLTPLLRPDTSNELPALTRILKNLATPEFEGSKWTFTAGYFNMTPEFRQLLLDSKPASGTIVAASPWANGFYGSKGISGMLPAGYTYLSRAFLNAVSAAGLSRQITVKEWRRGTVNTPDGWSYHAKGIWITLPGQKYPAISVIGSSNYTKRSYSLDLEANTLIVTSNPGLQQKLGEEEQWLQKYATKMTGDDYAKNERRVGLHVRLAMWIVSLVGGAL